MREGYIKNPVSYYLVMIFVMISCLVSSYYHWSLIVMGLIRLRSTIGMTAVYYSLTLFVLFPIAFWVLSTRNARQFSISNQIKNLGRQSKGSVKLALMSIYRRFPGRKEAKKMVKGDSKYHRITSVLFLVGLFVLMILYQFLMLNFVNWKNNIELWRVLACDSGLVSLNVIVVVILASIAYKLKSRRIPESHIQKT